MTLRSMMARDSSCVSVWLVFLFLREWSLLGVQAGEEKRASDGSGGERAG
jgi:hypothetical protein